MNIEHYDRVILGAGLYGLYSALYCCKRGEKVVVLERDPATFMRASTINQARVHQGYHYPRSISTAIKSACYFERFNKDFDICINRQFEQIYATSSVYSWTNGMQFKEFCKAAGIPCEEVNPEKYFNNRMCDGAFKTREYTYDAAILKAYLIDEIEKCATTGVIKCGIKICQIEKTTDSYVIIAEDGSRYESGYVLNATYAGTNQILHMAGFEKFGIKYELCEISLCEVNDNLRGVGITVMDGPFFSIMPFGKTGYHSLTSVTFTPHTVCVEKLPIFSCQKFSEGYCSEYYLGNCDLCPAKPETAFAYMAGLARKYMIKDYDFTYKKSLFSMKPILMSSEIDDSRPTVIRKYSEKPTFIGVLSGKINTVYDLEEVLNDDK